MKTTIMTFALALATMPLTFAQAPKPAAPAEGASKPAAAATAKTTKKHAKKAVKKTAKPAAGNSLAPVKK
jgi:hypothetical protein